MRMGHAKFGGQGWPGVVVRGSAHTNTISGTSGGADCEGKKKWREGKRLDPKIS